MRFTHALLRAPASTLAQGLTTRTLGSPDPDLTRFQYQAYQQALRQCGLEVTVLPADEAYPDGHYVEDVAVIYRDLACITYPGAPARRKEVASVVGKLPHQNRVVLPENAFLEGGDVLFCADRVLIGLSSRTNIAGAEFLKSALQAYDSSIKVDYVPFEGVLHLKTGMTELAPGILLRSPHFQTDYPFHFAEVITLPEIEEYAANVLPINDTIMIAKGYPTVSRLAQQHYQQVIELEMTEFQKMDGSLTCLSLRY